MAPISINGSGTVTGISAGGLPDDCITTADIAAGAVTQAKRSEQLTLGTAVASTSGTSIDFTGIPSWVKRVTVMFAGVSTNGTSTHQVQVGSGSFSTSGYLTSCGAINASTVGQAGSTTGVVVTSGLPAVNTFSGMLVLTLLGSNQWVASGNSQYNIAAGAIFMSAGYTPALGGNLDRVRITTVNGTDTFDAGSINIMYE